MLRKRQLVIDYHQKFGDEQGMRILDDLNRKFPWLKRSVEPVAPIDTNTIMVMQGEANVLKYIYNMIRKDPNEPQKRAKNEPIIE